MRRTKLQLPCPDSFGGIGDEVPREVALYTTDHIVVRGFAAFADYAECVVLHDGGATNAPQEALLHATLELQDCYFW